MKNKLMAVKTFDKMEKWRDAKNLLKEIRRAILQIKTNTLVYDALHIAKLV